MKEGTAAKRHCAQCDTEFVPKYEWSTMCWSCWWASPKGQEWARKKAAESNGWDRDSDTDYARQAQDRMRREAEQHRERFEQMKREQARRAAEQERQQQERFRRTYNDSFNGYGERPQAAPASAVVGVDKVLLRKLLQLCHPDKHGGSSLATTVTMELLKMKERL